MSEEKFNYTQFPNAILDHLTEFTSSEGLVLMLFVRQTFGWHKTMKPMSRTFIAKGTGLSEQTVVDAARSLVKKGIVEQVEDAGPRGTFGYKMKVIDWAKNLPSDWAKNLPSQANQLGENLAPNKETSFKETVNITEVAAASPPRLPIQKTKGKKYKLHPETKAILTYLIEKTGRPFSLECKSSLKFISSRLSEPGVTVAGVRQMIDRQVARWSGGEMEQYLRPETLFNATKFDDYYSAKDLPVKPYAAKTTTAPQIVNRNIGTYNEGQPSLVPYAEAIAAKRLAESADLRRAFRMAEQAKSEMLRRSQPGTTADGMCPVG
jgi:uncharacterized phage protein (TIGR02220 family)